MYILYIFITYIFNTIFITIADLRGGGYQIWYDPSFHIWYDLPIQIDMGVYPSCYDLQPFIAY